jgi:hypothetical protein
VIVLGPSLVSQVDSQRPLKIRLQELDLFMYEKDVKNVLSCCEFSLLQSSARWHDVRQIGAFIFLRLN